MADVSLLFNFLKGRDDVNPAINQTGDNLLKLAAKSQLSSGMMAASWTVVGTAFAGIAADAIAFVDATTPVLGLLAELPALGFAAAAGLGTLIIGFQGITAALKSSATASASNADQIISAEHNVQQAQYASIQASKDLAAAREAEMKSDRDLALQLQQANLSLAEAQLNVRDAQAALNQARQQGNPLQVAHAQLALQEAQLRVQEATNSLSDTQEQYNKRQQQGVGGSDQVQAALKKQADAIYQVGAAQRALAQAERGSGAAGAAAAAYAKLAPAAKLAVDVLKQLGPAWHSVQQAVQNSLFAGAATDIRRLGAEYLPVLRQQLPAIAAGWGQAFHGVAGLAQTPGFIKDINGLLANTAAFIRNAGQALAPVIDGFRQFAAVGGTFLPQIGNWINRIAVEFDNWARNARDSGRINKWITDGIAAAQKLWDIAKNLVGAIVGIFKAGADPSQNFLDKVIKATGAVKAWIDSAKGQGQLKEFFTSLRDAATQVWKIVGDVARALTNLGPGISTVTPYLTLTSAVVKLLADHMNLIRPLLPLIVVGFVAWKAAIAGIAIGKFVAGIVEFMTAEKTATVLQWLWNAAMYAFPVIAIVAGIALIVAGMILLYKHSETFRKIWDTTFAIAKTIVVDFVKLWVKEIQIIFDFFRDPAGTLKKAAVALWENILKKPVLAAINYVIDLLNGFTAHINSSIISTIDKLPGVSIPMIPAIPHLDTGGDIIRSGLAVVHAGERVLPAKAVASGTNGPVRVVLDFSGTSGNAGFDAFLKRTIRKMVHDDGRGNVQVAFGS